MIEKPKIFITPWIDLTAEDIDKIIKAGAHSARIHTGKTNHEKNIELIRYYNSRMFKFYLDLRGNKTSIDYIDEDQETIDLKLGDKVWIYENKKYKNFGVYDHYLKMGFIPEAIKALDDNNGNLTVDDGLVIFDIKRIIRKQNEVLGLETTVSKAKPVWIGDGVSSTNVYVHSGAKSPLTFIDINILKHIPVNLRMSVYYVAISFCESAKEILIADQALKNLGYKNSQVVPKVETVNGVKNIDQICKLLRSIYGPRTELQIGRSDLIMDAARSLKYVDANKLTDKIIQKCNKFGVKVSVLAMMLHSVRIKHKLNPDSEDWEPSATEQDYIRHLCAMGVYQIGLTNEMYINQPEKMVQKLYEIIG